MTMMDSKRSRDRVSPLAPRGVARLDTSDDEEPRWWATNKERPRRRSRVSRGLADANMPSGDAGRLEGRDYEDDDLEDEDRRSKRRRERRYEAPPMDHRYYLRDPPSLRYKERALRRRASRYAVGDLGDYRYADKGYAEGRRRRESSRRTGSRHSSRHVRPVDEYGRLYSTESRYAEPRRAADTSRSRRRHAADFESPASDSFDDDEAKARNDKRVKEDQNREAREREIRYIRAAAAAAMAATAKEEDERWGRRVDGEVVGPEGRHEVLRRAANAVVAIHGGGEKKFPPVDSRKPVAGKSAVAPAPAAASVKFPNAKPAAAAGINNNAAVTAANTAKNAGASAATPAGVSGAGGGNNNAGVVSGKRSGVSVAKKSVGGMLTGVRMLERVFTLRAALLLAITGAWFFYSFFGAGKPPCVTCGLWDSVVPKF